MFDKLTSYISNISAETYTVDKIDNCIFDIKDTDDKQHYVVTRNLTVYTNGHINGELIVPLDRELTDTEIKLFRYYSCLLRSFENEKTRNKYKFTPEPPNKITHSIEVCRDLNQRYTGCDRVIGRGFIFGWEYYDRYMRFDSVYSYPMRLYRVFIEPTIAFWNQVDKAYIKPAESMIEVRNMIRDKNVLIAEQAAQLAMIQQNHTAELAKHESKHATMAGELAESKRMREVLALEVVDYNDKLYDATMKINAHDSKFNDVSRQLAEKTTLLEAAGLKATMRDESLAKLASENKQLLAQLSEYQRAAAAGKGAIERIRTLEHENKQLMRKVSEAQCAIYDLENERDALQETVSGYEVELAELRLNAAKSARSPQPKAQPKK